jgi:predicted PurR-regulated permease PerM
MSDYEQGEFIGGLVGALLICLVFRFLLGWIVRWLAKGWRQSIPRLLFVNALSFVAVALIGMVASLLSPNPTEVPGIQMYFVAQSIIFVVDVIRYFRSGAATHP